MGLTERSFLERMEEMGFIARKSNADRIRAMTDEELSRWIWAVQSGIEHEDIVSTYGWMDWLKQEATDGT